MLVFAERLDLHALIDIGGKQRACNCGYKVKVYYPRTCRNIEGGELGKEVTLDAPSTL